MDFDWERISRLVRAPEFAGAAGSLVALRWVPGETWTERSVNLLSGMCLSWFVAPAISDFVFKITHEGARGALAFGVGLFGLSLTSAIFAAIREIKLADILTGWISRQRKE